MTEQGYYSILRWRSSATRDEARNVAVLLVDAEGTKGGIRAAPVSAISPRLHEQGIVDSILIQLTRQFEGDHKPSVGSIRELSESMQHSLYLTPPQATAVPDVELVLSALYRAYCAPSGGGGGAMTKGQVLDKVVNRVRRKGYEVRRGNYMGDFLFDAIVDVPESRPVALEVLSFATGNQRWKPTEHDAGHFLFALEKVNAQGLCVLQKPSDASHMSAEESFERVRRWFDGAKVPMIDVEGVEDALESYA